MSRTVLDTSYWIALFDPRDAAHQAVLGTEDKIELLTLVVPWPLLYETLRTRFVRRREWVARLDERLRKPNVSFIDDRKYCDEAYSLSVEYSTRIGRPLSMVDMLCRLLIDDPEVRIDFLLTTNPTDFRDVCASNNVQML